MSSQGDGREYTNKVLPAPYETNDYSPPKADVAGRISVLESRFNSMELQLNKLHQKLEELTAKPKRVTHAEK